MKGVIKSKNGQAMPETIKFIGKDAFGKIDGTEIR